MNLPRPRFTVRRLMFLIAIVAVSFGAISWVARMRARSYAYLGQAYYYEMLADHPDSGHILTSGRYAHHNENYDIEQEWAWRMAAKYMRLSYYPWLDADPDPPLQLLTHPRTALQLPAPDESLRASVRCMSPPAWTFLWTRHPLRPPIGR
ncbi:MAG: hypothetical protein ACYC61_09805 [Isosphaeraceae bacterium]